MQIHLLKCLKVPRVGSPFASVDKLFYSLTPQYDNDLCPFT